MTKNTRWNHDSFQVSGVKKTPVHRHLHAIFPAILNRMEKTLRLFIAVPLPDSVKAQICAGPLSSAALNRPGIRPVPANNLHLTLDTFSSSAVSTCTKPLCTMARRISAVSIFSRVSGRLILRGNRSTALLYCVSSSRSSGGRSSTSMTS